MGRLGEAIAVHFLRERGVEIVARNVRSGPYEVDIVASLQGVRFVVEVKAALRASGIDPVDNLDDRKLDAVCAAARSLHPPVWRVDLVAVVIDGTGADVRWLPDVA